MYPQIEIGESRGSLFCLALDEPKAIACHLPIIQDTDVMLTEDMPITNMPGTFTLPGEGV